MHGMACARHVQEFLLLLELSLLALSYAQEAPAGGGAGNSTNNDNNDSPSTGTIVGFSVVLTFFLLSVCVVIMICFRYGVCKCLKVRPISRTRPNVSVMVPRERRQSSQRVSNSGQQATVLPVVQSRPSSVITLQNLQQGNQNRKTSLHNRPTEPPPPYPGMAYPYQPCKPRHTSTTPLHFRMEGPSENDSSSERFYRSIGMESITSSDQSISQRHAYPSRTPPPSYDTQV